MDLLDLKGMIYLPPFITGMKVFLLQNSRYLTGLLHYLIWIHVGSFDQFGTPHSNVPY